MEVFYNYSKMHLSLLDAKTDRVSAQFERFGTIIEPKVLQVSEEVLQLKTLVSELVEDMKGLKNRQDMLYIKQDRIQSPLAEGHGSIQDFRSASKETSLVYTPSPGFVSPPAPNAVATPALYQSMPKFTSPTCRVPPAIDLTQQAQDISANLESIFQGSEHLTQDKSYSELIVHDATSTFSDEEIRSILSLDWGGNPIPSTTQSDPGACQAAHTAQLIPRVTSEKRSDHRNPLTDCVYSNSLIDPDIVVKELSTNIGLDTVGRVGVSLARYSFFGDDILRISTQKGKGKKHLALNPHKLEAMISFIHNLEPFKNLSKEEFDTSVRARVERALKDHLKSPANRSSAAK